MHLSSLITFILLSQCVQCIRLNLTITDVRQCQPVTLNFPAIEKRTTLMILPLSSTPILMPVPKLDSDAPTSSVIIPLSAGDVFIASVDDTSGNSVSWTSDILTVSPSPTGDTSCLQLSDTEDPDKPRYELLNTPTQCQELSVSYQTVTAPSVRLFEPMGGSFFLDQTANDPSQRVASYLVNVEEGREVVLLFDDGARHRQVSSLLKVAKEGSGSKSCNIKPPADRLHNLSAKKKKDSVPKGVIIGCSAGGAVVLIIILAMIVFIVSERRKQRLSVTGFYTRPSLKHPQEENVTRTPFELGPMTEARNIVEEESRPDPSANLSYVRDAFDDDKVSQRRGSSSSWAHEITDVNKPPPRTPSMDPFIIQSADIEQMLNAASPPTEIRYNFLEISLAQEEPRLSEPLSDLYAAKRKAMGEARHQRPPSDVPADTTGTGSFSYLLEGNPFSSADKFQPAREDPEEPARPASDVVRPMSIESKKSTDDDEGHSKPIKNQTMF